MAIAVSVGVALAVVAVVVDSCSNIYYVGTMVIKKITVLNTL